MCMHIYMYICIYLYVWSTVFSVETFFLLFDDDRIQNLPASIQLKRLPPGGLTSLLYHFHVTLDDANNVMDTIQPSWTIGVVRTFPTSTGLLVLHLYVEFCFSAPHRLVIPHNDCRVHGIHPPKDADVVFTSS